MNIAPYPTPSKSGPIAPGAWGYGVRNAEKSPRLLPAIELLAFNTAQDVNLGHCGLCPWSRISTIMDTGVICINAGRGMVAPYHPLIPPTTTELSETMNPVPYCRCRIDNLHDAVWRKSFLLHSMDRTVIRIKDSPWNAVIRRPLIIPSYLQRLPTSVPDEPRTL